jgi:hypothetical protein
MTPYAPSVGAPVRPGSVAPNPSQLFPVAAGTGKKGRDMKLRDPQMAKVLIFLLSCSALAQAGSGGGGGGGNPLAPGTYTIADPNTGNRMDLGWALNPQWGDGTYAYLYISNSSPSQVINFTSSGQLQSQQNPSMYLYDEGGSLGLRSSGDTFSIVASGSGFTIQDQTAGGLYVNSASAIDPPNQLPLSSSPTVWNFSSTGSGSGGSGSGGSGSGGSGSGLGKGQTYSFMDGNGFAMDLGWALNPQWGYPSDVYLYNPTEGISQQLTYTASGQLQSVQNTSQFLNDRSGVLAVGASGDTFTINPSGTGYTIHDDTAGLYVNSPGTIEPPNTLNLSATPTVWTAKLLLNVPSPTMSSLTCASTSITGAATDSCTATLTAAAPSTGQVINLASNNSSVAVPASVTVPSGSTSASFNATVSAVSTAQTATLTASTGSSSKTLALQLNAATSSLSLNSTSIAFGSVDLNTTVTQSLTVTATGPSAVTISGVSITGTGFAEAGISAPLTLSPNQSATLNATFDPTTTGSVTGQLTITSNATSGGTNTVNLTGTGQSVAHSVNLSWSAPSSSSDPVAGYNIYRATSGSSSYQQINSSTDTQTTYQDNNVQSGQSFSYCVKSVDGSGNESVPSNTATVSIP